MAFNVKALLAIIVIFNVLALLAFFTIGDPSTSNPAAGPGKSYTWYLFRNSQIFCSLMIVLIDIL